MEDDVYCGYCKYYLEGNCQKNNTKVKEDRLSDCQLFEPLAIGVLEQDAMKILAVWWSTREGE